MTTPALWLQESCSARTRRAGAQARSWRLRLRTGRALIELAHVINPIVLGWMRYYGAFYSSALHPLLKRIDHHCRPRIALKVSCLSRSMVHGNEKRRTVPQEPHRDEVDRAIGVECCQVCYQSRLQDLSGELVG